MTVQVWTYLIVSLTFALYIGIAVRSRVHSTAGFYVAGRGVPALANGMATAADWMSAASFISMAGLISFMGYTGTIYLMGWTGGYVLLAMLLAPYLRKYGKFTTSEFVGDRYYSQTARVVAAACTIFVSFTYIAGQMRGVGVVFSRFLEVDVNVGVHHLHAGRAILGPHRRLSDPGHRDLLEDHRQSDPSARLRLTRRRRVECRVVSARNDRCLAP